MIKLIPGWRIRNKPFSKKEFNKSVLKNNGVVKSYSEYLSDLARFEREAQKKKTPKRKTPEKNHKYGFY